MNSYSIKISSCQADKLKNFLESKNAVFDVVQYSIWRAKLSSFQAVYYSSGKFLIQGKNIDNIVSQAKVILGIPEDEKNMSLLNFDCDKYIGTDESGKGDFFGPLVVAGVQISGQNKQKFIDLGIKDSKKLNDKKILEFSNIIKADAVHCTVVIMPEKYNELYSGFNNLNKLLAWGHARVIENILEKSPCSYGIADKFGDESLIANALLSKGKKINLVQLARAEADIAVASASVLARAEFVKRMNNLSFRYEMEFPKGASPKVIEQAKNFINQYSYQRLKEVAKMNFKTALELKNL